MTAYPHESGYWYEHSNGSLIFKRWAVVNFVGPASYFDSPFVKSWWFGHRDDCRRPQDVNPDAPVCPQCHNAARLTDGREVYSHRQDLHDKPIWVCDPCGAYVGCDPGGTKPLGTPAGKALRAARMDLHHKRLDPLWQTADRLEAYKDRPLDDAARKAIQQVARRRVYAYLAHKMGLSQFHSGECSLEQCRQAWTILTEAGDYSTIRKWHKDAKDRLAPEIDETSPKKETT